MKHRSILVFGSLLFSITHSMNSYIDQDFDAKLNALQQTINVVVAQSNLDPAVAQDILDKANEFNQYAQNNIQQDAFEIRAASGISSILETVDTMLQAANMPDAHALLSTFKHSARVNVIHTLLMGLYPGKLRDEQYYTDPYVESAGFILNDWAFSKLIAGIITAATPTTIGTALSLNTTSPIKTLFTRIAVMTAAHYAWLLQKKIALSQLATMQAQNN
jgi:hypothetical protein